MISYVDVFGFQLRTDGDCEPGDVVVTGECSTPRFTVVAVHDGRAWLRGETGSDHVVDVARCRRVS